MILCLTLNYELFFPVVETDERKTEILHWTKKIDSENISGDKEACQWHKQVLQPLNQEKCLRFTVMIANTIVTIKTTVPKWDWNKYCWLLGIHVACGLMRLFVSI